MRSTTYKEAYVGISRPFWHPGNGELECALGAVKVLETSGFVILGIGVD